MYKYSAKKRGIKFRLTFVQLKELISQNCHYCDNAPVHKPVRTVKNKNISLEGRGIVANGIDRKNNKIGYIINNCVPCCPDCNFMKQDMDIGQFLNKIIQIYGNLPKEI